MAIRTSCGIANVKFQLRRDSSSDWSASNPVLRPGEPGYDSTVNGLKIGDGMTPWSGLSYIVGGVGSFQHGNVLVVDSVYGDDVIANASAPYFTQPFKTVDAAISKATSGTTVWIYPGTYTLSSGITIPNGSSIRGLSLQTCVLQMNVTSSTTMVTMGANCRVEDLTINLTCTGSTAGVVLKGVVFPDVAGQATSQTSKLRTCVVSVRNSAMATGLTSTVIGVECTGTGVLTPSVFSFNSIKGSTINVYSNGAGNKRGILVSGTNQVSTRDTNIFVDKPTDTASTGSYVGVETNDGANGSIQLRSTTVGVVVPGAGELYTASDILQTTPSIVTNPTYLASPGIQVGPGTDLVTKTAGGGPFSTYVYPTIIYYGLKGDLKTGGTPTGAYMWPGTQAATNNTFPDPGPTPAFFRVQQPFILSGINIFMSTAPGTGNTTTFKVRRTPYLGTIADVPNYSITLGATDTNWAYYNTSQTFGTGDLIHVFVSYTGGAANTTHDITVQLDCF